VPFGTSVRKHIARLEPVPLPPPVFARWIPTLTTPRHPGASDNQFHLANATEQDVREVKVITDGSDLVLIKRVFGTFYTPMDLHHFPVDAQDLRIDVECQCSANGPFPVRFELNESRGVAGIIEKNFTPINLWVLHPIASLVLTESTVDAGATTKTYPAFTCSVRVCRRWSYYFVNIALPMESLTLLSICLPICIPQANSGDRLSVTLGIVITAAAYKFAVASMIPAVSYLTLIDKYVLSLSGVLLLCAVQNAVLGIRVRDGSGNPNTPLVFSDAADYGTTLGLLGIWLLVHAIYWCRLQTAMKLRVRQVGEETAKLADRFGDVDSAMRESPSSPSASRVAGRVAPTGTV
jgi:hypothetical protein